jgi:uncharacterized protein YndB with AHSA1/START domain
MTDHTTEPDELLFTRVFDAPRELVFRCMLEPEHLTHFWGPIGTSTPLGNITVDARPGGVFETIMVSDADGAEYAMRATFTEVVAPERIVWTDPASGMTTATTFVDLGPDGTEVHIRQTKVPEPMRSPEAQAGFLSSLDKFASYLATNSAGSGG